VCAPFCVQVCFLSVLRHVEPDCLVAARGTQRDEEADDLEQDEADDAAIGNRGNHRGHLDQKLTGIAVERAVNETVQFLRRKHSRQQRTDRTTQAVRSHHVQ
jgi:hypothetical protein